MNSYLLFFPLLPFAIVVRKTESRVRRTWYDDEYFRLCDVTNSRYRFLDTIVVVVVFVHRHCGAFANAKWNASAATANEGVFWRNSHPTMMERTDRRPPNADVHRKMKVWRVFEANEMRQIWTSKWKKENRLDKNIEIISVLSFSFALLMVVVRCMSGRPAATWMQTYERRRRETKTNTQ